MRREWIKENKLSFPLICITLFVVVFLADIAAKSLPKATTKTSKVDTIYIDNRINDSLIQELVNQIHEINTKMTPKKVYIKSKPDTIRIDANIKLN